METDSLNVLLQSTRSHAARAPAKTAPKALDPKSTAFKISSEKTKINHSPVAAPRALKYTASSRAVSITNPASERKEMKTLSEVNTVASSSLSLPFSRSIFASSGDSIIHGAGASTANQE